MNDVLYALLGAALALLLVLLGFALVVRSVTKRALGYAARFRGFQANRNTRNEMTFGGIVDETPLDEDGYPIEPPLEPDNRIEEQELQ